MLGGGLLVARMLRAEGVEAVVHLAAIVSPGGPAARAVEFEVDVRGARNVLGACVARGVRQLIVTSSGAPMATTPTIPSRCARPITTAASTEVGGAANQSCEITP